MVAAMLGTPLMAWQQQVADVILEIDPETGRLAYDEYTITVPRQSGKTTFELAKVTHRCSATGFFGERQQMVYMAQTRNKAREQLEERFSPALKKAPKFKASLHLGNGNEHLRFPNGSKFAIEANTEKAGHGGTLDEAIIDEAFSQVDNRAEQAVGPAMITRPNKQLGVVSTMGWLDASPYFMEKVRAGRAVCKIQLTDVAARKGTAYFEWSAPDGSDPSDENVWLDCMPAVHRPTCAADCADHTIPLAAIRSEWEKAKRAGKVKDFMRAYLNMAVTKPREGEETALGNWAACRVELTAEQIPPVAAIGVAVSFDRAHSSLAFSGLLEDGRPLVAPVTEGYRPGTDWLAAEAARISVAHNVPVAVDIGGPAGEAMAEDIEAAGGAVIRCKLAEYVSACADMYDRVHAQDLAHTGAKDLDDSVAGARWRPVGDGRRVFGRKQSESDVSMLEATTLAMWAAEHGGGPSVYDSRDVVML